MPASPVTRFVRHRGATLRVAARRTTWREALTLDFSRMGFAVPLRVGVAVALVFLIGGFTGHQDVAGFAALGHWSPPSADQTPTPPGSAA